MLVSLTDMKTYLELTGSTYDTFLTDQLQLISDSVELYCGRKFEQASYTQTFYKDDFDVPQKHLYLFHYPLISLDAAETGDGTDILSQLRFHKPTAKVIWKDRRFFQGYFTHIAEEVIFEYTAGFATIPTPVASVIKTLVEERYNKKVAGIDLNFGRDVQSVSVPGTINVAFDYTLQANERKNALGMILGDYTNVLDMFRSERPLVGEILENYVE